MQTLLILGIVSVILAVCFFIASVTMFIGYRIPTLWKDSRGALEQKQIDEIRAMRRNDINNRNKVNVFEELERKAKPRKTSSQSIRLNTLTGENNSNKLNSNKNGTVVLKNKAKAINSNFIIEKDITFVCTSEVI
ncbi:MAG: hypothetical protein HFJ97_07735 [Eubacterium sp.]|nr:hypothetical protein [Eubacterium sp.]